MSRLPRPRCFPAVVLGVLALAGGVAHGQATGQGTCTGGIAATIGIAAVQDTTADPPEAPTSVALTYAPYIFGKAECDCDTKDVVMRIQLSMCLAAGTQGNPTVWVGNSSCSTYQTRTTTNQTQCQQYFPTNVVSTSFNAAGGNCSTTSFFDVSIPARALFSPNTGSCDISTASNQVFIFIGPDQTMPVATCSLPLTEQVTGPTAVVNTNASSGDGAITVQWSSPPVGSLQPDSYQVLCSDEDGNPIPDKAQDAAYSTCLATGIRRRQNIFGATSVTTTPDGGTSNRADLGVTSTSSALSAGQAEGPGEAVPHADGGPDEDMAGADLAGVDMATGGGTSLTSPRRPTLSGLPAPFDTLDPRYICTERIPVTAQDYNQRIDGLTNNRKYKFVVLAIDLYGNATASSVVEGEPRPIDTLYSRYREAGGTAQGFCFVATAAFGDYDHPQVRVLRAFRDGVLAQSALGRAFVRGYYAASPPLARFIEGGAVRRFVARALLWPLVGLALLALELGSLGLALLVAGGLPACALWYRRRLKRRRRALVEVPA